MPQSLKNILRNINNSPYVIQECCLDMLFNKFKGQVINVDVQICDSRNGVLMNTIDKGLKISEQITLKKDLLSQYM